MAKLSEFKKVVLAFLTYDDSILINLQNKLLVSIDDYKDDLNLEKTTRKPMNGVDINVEFKEHKKWVLVLFSERTDEIQEAREKMRINAWEEKAWIEAISAELDEEAKDEIRAYQTRLDEEAKDEVRAYQTRLDKEFRAEQTRLDEEFRAEQTRLDEEFRAKQIRLDEEAEEELRANMNNRMCMRFIRVHGW